MTAIIFRWSMKGENNIKLSCGCEFDENNKPITICELHACWLSEWIEKKKRDEKLNKGGY